MAEAQHGRTLPVPPSGAKKSPFGAGQAKGDVSRSPTMPTLGAAKKAPPPVPRKPAEDSDLQQSAGPIAVSPPKVSAGPPKLPPRGNTVAQLGGRSPPAVAPCAIQPGGANPPESSAETAPAEQSVDTSAAAPVQVENLAPTPTEFEPPKTVKPTPSFRDTIAIPNSAVLSHQPRDTNINNANGASPTSTPEPGQGLTAALADPLFRKIEVTLAQKRDNIANELLTTEQSYLKSLSIVNEVYRKPMIDAVKTGQLAIGEDIVTDIFSRNFPDILRVNFTLLSGLVERLSSWSAEQVLGDVLLDLTPFLKMYTQYTANYERSNQLLDEFESKEPMASFLAKCNENPVRAGLGLKAFLIMPIQRIPRYRLLLEDLVKNTPETHPDHKNLNLALERLKIVAEQVDKAIYEQKNRELMLKIQKRVGDAIQIIEPGRIFVREGELTKVCRKDTKKRFFVLFSDMVLYATELPTGRLMNVNLLKMTSLGIRDLPDDPKRNQANALQISSEKKSFVVMAASAVDKSAWIADLNKALDKFEESGKTVKNDSRQRRVSNLAPVWVPDSEARTCTICGIKFTLTNRRHHCRQCGNVVCGKCSSKKKDLPGQGKQRVCDICFDKPYDASSAREAHVPSADDGLYSDSDDDDIQSSETQNPADNQATTTPVVVSPSAGTAGDFCEAAFDYEPPAGNPAPKKLPFKAGDMLKILQRDNSGWWLAELSGQKGWVPAAFLKVQS